MRRDTRNFHFSAEGAGVFGLVSIPILLAIACFAAWATHIVWIIKVLASNAGATAGQMVLGALGAFMPPVGMIHGVMIWFGVGF